MKINLLKVITLSALFCGFVLPNNQLKAQEEEQSTIQAVDTLNRWSSFPEGNDALMRYLAKQSSYANYPVDAWDDGAEGRVIVVAEIQEDGSLDKVRVLKKVHPALAKAAIKTIKAMPRWIPALRDGKAVKELRSFVVRYNRPYRKYLFHPAHTPAMFPGEGLVDYISKHLKYPKDVIKLGVKARVLVQFCILEDGKVADIKILKGFHPIFDDRVVDLVKRMPRWIPAKLKDGTPIPSLFTLPVVFRSDGYTPQQYYY